MIESQKYYLESRDVDSNNRHTELIENAHVTTCRPDELFRELCKLVFKVHSYGMPVIEEIQWPGDDEFNKWILPSGLSQWISIYFHKKIYRPPENLRKGIAHDGALVSLKERFIDRLTMKIKPGVRNSITFLIGDVGTGKSTLASNLVIKNGLDWITNRKVIPLRIDMDFNFNHELPPKGTEKRHLLFYIYDHIVSFLRKYDKIDEGKLRSIMIDTKFDRFNDDTGKCEHGVKELIRQLYEACELSLLLIIDNFDFLYHIYDRALFVHEATIRAMKPPNDHQNKIKSEREIAHGMIEYLIKAFSYDPEALANLGINILLVLRQDSLMHYKALVHEQGIRDPLVDTFRIDPPDLQDVTNRHLDLMRATIERWPEGGLRAIYHDAVDKIANMAIKTLRGQQTQKITAAQRLHEDLLSLSRQGMRQIMEHYGRYIWLPVSIDNRENKIEVTMRFQKQYFPGLISFMQNGNRLFSQFDSEFPNIYLIRGDWRGRQQNEPWETLCIPHRHTYWLKRIILEYITQQQLSGKNVIPDDIYDIFCNSNDRAETYEDSIVRLCLGSLAQVEKSHVIDFEFSADHNLFEVSKIYLSERGWRLMGYVSKGSKAAEDIFIDTFAYLQIIMDDYILPIPKCLFDIFRYEKELDYGYLAAPYNIYGNKVEEMVRKKITQVFFFLDILEISLDCEKIIFGKAFERLNKRKIIIPEVSKIRDRLVKSIEPVQQHLEKYGDFEYKNHIPKREEYFKKLKDELESAYCACIGENDNR